VLPNRAWGGRVAAAFSLLDAQDRPVAVFRSIADPGDWIAGTSHRVLDTFVMPRLKPGVYRWAVALVDRFRNDRPWIALAASDAAAAPAWLPVGPACTA
jgi:hypothetical protein